VDRIVSEIISLGAKQALPGEFSFRSVLNEKMSLDDASRLQSVFANEGLGASSAAKLLGFSRSHEDDIQKLFDRALESVASARGRVEAAIDFSEAEEEQAQDIASAQARLDEVRRSLRDLINSYEVFVSNARVPRVVLFGKPNAGKSTFLNLMCGAKRSIVSSVAGTTRDYVEVNLKTERGIPFRLVDTAGLRFLAAASKDLRDQIEEAGIEMGLELMEAADVLVWIQDARESKESFGEARVDRILSQKKSIRVLSHADLAKTHLGGEAPAFDLLGPSSGAASDFVFAKIEEHILAARSSGLEPSSGAILSQRQETQVREALLGVDEAMECLSGARPLEIVGDSLRAIELALRRAKGEGVSEDYIGQIFTQFCLGK
jgi:tRNA modification GTPase